MSHDPTSPRLRRADRDDLIAQALEHELASGRKPAAAHCLDAETLAAWIDGGLDAHALAAAEAHASHCERCQAMLATVTSTLPAAGPLAHGARARGALSLWWVAPLAAGTAAVTLWMVVPQQPIREPGAPSIVASREAAPAEAPLQQPAPPVESRRNAPPPQSSQRVADAAKTTGDAVPAAPAPRDPQARPEAGQRAETAAPPLRAEANVGRESKTAEPAAAPPATLALQQRMRQSTPVEVVSPDPSRRWRTAADGLIERSDNGGRTWTVVRLSGLEEIAAGASPSPAVCWFVGARGIVLLAVDAATFVRLPFPETVDLVGVTAVDARAATVTAADGRTFNTTDSGRTWGRF